MVTYNPVPGKIFDISVILSILTDYDGLISFRKEHLYPEPESSTLIFYRFIRKCNISFDDDIKFLFHFINGCKFFGNFLWDTKAFYRFDSTNSFIDWIRNHGTDVLMPNVIQYLNNFSDETKDIRVNEHSTLKEIYSFVSSLKLLEKWKFAVISIFLDITAYASKLADILEQCNALLSDLRLEYSEYIQSIENRYYGAEDLQRIACLLSPSFDLAKLEDAVYSFSFLNDGMIFYVNSDSPIRFILGSNVEKTWHDKTTFDSSAIELLGKAVGDGKRLQILKLLENKSMYATELAKKLHIPHNSLFYHMNLLLDSNLINVSIEGRKTYYSINEDRIKGIGHYISCYYNILTKKT